MIKKKEFVCITCLEGAKSNINFNLLSADIMIPIKFFKEKKLNVEFEEKYKPVKSSGFILEYDTLYSKIDESSNFRSFFDSIYFFKKSYFKNTLLFTKNDYESRFVRLDSTLVIDDIDNIRRIKIGDFYTKSTFFSPTIRVGGVQIGTDFRLKPDLITYPLPDFAGETSLPSSVDIFLGNSRIFSKNLTPGPFEIKNIPITTPEGNLRVVIKDVLGREKVIELPYITHPNLLKEGLSEYNLSIGAIRKNYQLKDFNYGRLIVNTFYKRGITSKYTAEFDTYFEGFDKFSVGMSNYFLNRFIGLISPQFALSYDKEKSKTGYMYGINLKKGFKIINFGIDYKNFSEDFAKPQSVYGKIKESLNFFTSLRLPIIGSISGSYVKRKYTKSETRGDESNLNVSINRSLFKKIFLNFSYNIYSSSSDSRQSFSVSVNIPLGNRFKTSYRYQNSDGSNSHNLTLSKATTESKGVSYNLTANKSNGNELYRGYLTYDGEYFSSSSALSYNKNSYRDYLSYRIGLSGSVIYLDKDLYFRRKINQSFAIVKITPPVENAVILANNRKVGETDKKGTVFIPFLSPYTPNEIRIDPESVDMKTYIDETIYSFIPYENHGYVLKFRSRKVNSIRLKLLLPDGSFPPAGSKIWVDGKPGGILGFKGKAYIENISPGKHTLAIDYLDGECVLDIELDDSIVNKIVPHVGTYKCKLKDINRIIAKKTMKVKKEHKIIKTKNSKNKTSKPISKHKIKKENTNQNIDVINVDFGNFQDFEDFLEFRENITLEY